MFRVTTRSDDWVEPRVEPTGGRTKRFIDLLVASFALILLSPLMLIVAGVILLFEGWPVLFAHTRVGYGGRQFSCLKFRTMCTNADQVLRKYLHENPGASEEWKQTQKLRVDPRISSLGQTLRRTSIDELPQLFNVFRGEMSCVGPRPITKAEAVRYGKHYHLYLKTRPGMTGPWQVGGRSETSYEGRVALDSDYVRHWSVSRDLLILLRTVVVVANKRGSY